MLARAARTANVSMRCAVVFVGELTDETRDVGPDVGRLLVLGTCSV